MLDENSLRDDKFYRSHTYEFTVYDFESYSELIHLLETERREYVCFEVQIFPDEDRVYIFEKDGEGAPVWRIKKKEFNSINGVWEIHTMVTLTAESKRYGARIDRNSVAFAEDMCRFIM